MTSAEAGSQTPPGWASAVTILGWLIVAVAVLCFGLLVMAMEIATAQRPGQSDLGTITILAGMTIWVIGFGLMLAIAGRSQYPSAASSWLKLWAWFLVVVGLLLSVGLPIFVVGCLMTELAQPHDPASAQAMTTTCAVIAGVGFVLGVAIIAVAIVWGRRLPKAPDVVDVFS